MNRAGRIKAASTVNRELRRKLNQAAPALAEKILAKALAGDVTAMLAASQLLLAANQETKK